MIRKATLDDIPAIQAMAEVVFRQTYATMISPEQVDYMMVMMYSYQSLLTQMTSGRNVFLIEDGKGFTSFHHVGRAEDGLEVFHLDKLYVMPSQQGKGLGKMLFDAVVSEIRKTSFGQPRIELNVNRDNPAVGFYEHIGMRRVRQGDFPIGKGFFMNDYIMSIDL